MDKFDPVENFKYMWFLYKEGVRDAGRLRATIWLIAFLPIFLLMGVVLPITIYLIVVVFVGVFFTGIGYGLYSLFSFLF